MTTFLRNRAFQAGLAGAIGGFIIGLSVLAIKLRQVNPCFKSDQEMMGTTTYPPIKVRGGAMTFLTNNASQWSPSGPSRFCTIMDISQIGVFGYQGLQINKFPLTKLKQGWTIAFSGYTEDGNISLNGIKMTASPKVGCPGTQDSKNDSVTIEPLGSGAFYGPPEPPHGSFYTEAKRYHDDGCTLNKLDLCEHTSQITITTHETGADQAQYVLQCKDDDCRVEIGVPK